MAGHDDLIDSGVDRRGFLRHAAWAGGAVAVAVGGGLVTAQLASGDSGGPAGDFTFVQISDSHLGFEGKANADVAGTFQQSIDVVNALPERPDFVIHTGDVTHFSTTAQFDQARQMMTGLRTGEVFVLPGEHDAVDDDGQKYLRVFGKGTQGTGWFSFDHRGVHFIGLANTSGGQATGHLGDEQRRWLRQDVARLSSETPVIVFAHIPLFDLYQPWGWVTDDAEPALALLRRFASVSCFNGHIHQIVSRVEGDISFHTCASTGYPLPAPGAAPAPNPVALPAPALPTALGAREVAYRGGAKRPAYVDLNL